MSLTRKKITTCLLVLILGTAAQAQVKMNEADTLKEWDRKYFTKPLNKAFVCYFIYGNFSVDFKLSARYRTKGIPEGIELMHYGPEKHPEVVSSMLTGYLWENLKKVKPDLSRQIFGSKECFVIKGEVTDNANLNYLRDIVGIITYLLDHGGVSVFDTQSFMFFGKEEWSEKIFDPNGAVPRHHVMILWSEEKGGKWYHTRGKIKFGRPDLSIHQVTPEYEEAVQDLFNRFIEYEAFGAIIPNGKEIKMKNLPTGMRCENKGSMDDPDFNNVHVEINWR